MYHIITESVPQQNWFSCSFFSATAQCFWLTLFWEEAQGFGNGPDYDALSYLVLHAKIQDCFQTGVWNSMYKQYPNNSSHCYWGVGTELESRRINTAEIKTSKLFPCVVWKLQSFEFRFIVHTCQALYPYYLRISTDVSNTVSWLLGLTAQQHCHSC